LEQKTGQTAKEALEKLKSTMEEVKDKLRPIERAMELRKNEKGNPLTAAD